MEPAQQTAGGVSQRLIRRQLDRPLSRFGGTLEFCVIAGNLRKPGSGTGPYQGTDACEFIACYGGINPEGTITSFYVDQDSTYHGYLRAAGGQVVRFDVSGATAGNFQGTLPLNISPEGEVTGWYVDSSGMYHGFVRILAPEERDDR